jgi:hypothetical protein
MVITEDVCNEVFLTRLHDAETHHNVSCALDSLTVLQT